jgi:hypothetical protein
MSENPKNYTCQDYRQEMVLVGLKKRLANQELSEEERLSLLNSIESLEKEMGLD